MVSEGHALPSGRVGANLSLLWFHGQPVRAGAGVGSSSSVGQCIRKMAFEGKKTVKTTRNIARLR